MNNVKALNVPTFTYYRKEMQLNSLEVNTMYFIVSILIIAAIIKINRTKISNTIPKRRLLTMEEYNKEAQDFTAKQLEDLKEYCTSPGCNAWKLIRRLNRPDRYHFILCVFDSLLSFKYFLDLPNSLKPKDHI